MSKLPFMISEAWNKSRCLFLIVVLQNIFKATVPLINVLGLGFVVNALLLENSMKKVLSIILLYSLTNLAVSIIENILSYFQFVQMRKVTNMMQFQFAKDALNINYHYVLDGKLIDLKKKAMNANPSIYLLHFGNVLNQLLQFTGIVYIISRLSPVFILLMLFTCSISVLLTFKSRETQYEFNNSRIKSDRIIDYLYKVMSEYRFAKEVRMNGADRFMNIKFKTIVKEHLNKFLCHISKLNRLDMIKVSIVTLQSAVMYLYFTYQVFITQITIAEYTVLLGTTTLLNTVLIAFFDYIAQLRNVCKDIDYYHEYTDMVKKYSSIAESENIAEVKMDFSRPTIAFENVSFTYPGTEVPVLKNINFVINYGESVGLVGLNGSGKTTLVKLLVRLYDPDEGRITINNVDIKKLPFHQYNSYISTILQDFTLFAYSIRENLVFGKECDESILLEYINQCGLKDKVETLQKGLDTSIYRYLDSDGVEFSGGEGQKLALARALVKNAPILIMDEPTSALDPVAEYELFAQLSRIAKGRNALFISHRLYSTRFCNKIIVLNEGEIREIGNHDELIKAKNFYAELFNAQARYYQENGVLIP